MNSSHLFNFITQIKENKLIKERWVWKLTKNQKIKLRKMKDQNLKNLINLSLIWHTTEVLNRNYKLKWRGNSIQAMMDLKKNPQIFLKIKNQINYLFKISHKKNYWKLIVKIIANIQKIKLN